MEGTGHGVSYHGGFNVWDLVEVKLSGEWSDELLRIQRFDGMSVMVGAQDGSYSVVVSIHDIRNPNLVRRAQ